MRKITVIGTTLGAALVLASCQQNSRSGPETALTPQVAPTPPVTSTASINGKWVPTDENAAKVYYNEFRNGKFVSRSPDGAQTIAAGQYTVSQTGEISMNWYSEARKANASAKCTRLSNSELQCTSGSSVFNLRKA